MSFLCPALSARAACAIAAGLKEDVMEELAKHREVEFEARRKKTEEDKAEEAKASKAAAEQTAASTAEQGVGTSAADLPIANGPNPEVCERCLVHWLRVSFGTVPADAIPFASLARSLV
jgi:hypothetical protein